MAAPVTRNILRVPGNLVADPTDLTAAFPYGGTQLGLVRRISLRLKAEHHVEKAEEWGSAAVEVYHGGYPLFLAATLRGLDSDALAAIFPDTATGSPSGDKKVLFRVDNGRAGTALSTLAMKLLFVPEASVRHRALLIRDAIPVLAEDAEPKFSAAEELELNVVFYGRPDSSNRVAELAYIKDLTL